LEVTIIFVRFIKSLSKTIKNKKSTAIREIIEPIDERIFQEKKVSG